MSAPTILLTVTAGLLLACGSPETPAESTVDTAPAPADETVAEVDAVTGYVDPVCMMDVGADAKHTYAHEGVTYGFCSSGCKALFGKDPQGYLAQLEE